jgi:hypothetical protein
MSTLVAGDKRHIPFSINATDLAAGTPQYFNCPFDGFIAKLEIVVQSVVGTGGVIKVQKSSIVDGSDAIAGLADVTGASVTVANSAEAGFRQVGVATGDAQTNRKVSKGDLIALNVDAAFATSGAINGQISLEVSQPVAKAAGY